MNKNKARDPLSQRILDLTLEMIFLLTGEVDIKVRLRSQIHEQNHEKILELSNQIIRLLTGEVPIRCEDVTVYLSMEEWEYVERHKDLYEDIMMEDHQPVITLDKSVWGEFHAAVSLWDIGCENGNEILSNNVEKDLNKTRKGRAESATSTERESLASEERHVPEKENYPITEPAEYSPPDIKEEPAVREEGNLKDHDVYKHPVYTRTEYNTHIKAEIDSHEEGDITDPDLFLPTEHTQTEYPFIQIKKESPTWEEGNLTDTSIYKDIITKNSVCRENSKSSSLMGKIAFSESDLVIHEINCKEEALFSSTALGDNFTPPSGLKHQKVHNEGQPFSCSECEESFTDRLALKKHQSVHTGKKLFKCSECGKCFTWASSLARHKRIHKGEKTFKCNECGKCFNWASCLARHKKIHTGDKPFNCTECGKCFTRASYLAAHKLIHTGNIPFNCTQCGKYFTQASHLARHKMIHTGEKPFKCSECGKCFIQSSDLAAHEMVHRGERPFICTTSPLVPLRLVPGPPVDF
uniref:C2H2-type domain-containing protein n=1 Tax=Leptobrachium leishanense TaxID=445787 RepID=A0A8C5MGA9_9ANUR